MATFIELDARDDSQGCNVTVAEIEMPQQTPGNINNSIATRLVGKTIAQVKDDIAFPGGRMMCRTTQLSLVHS